MICHIAVSVGVLMFVVSNVVVPETVVIVLVPLIVSQYVVVPEIVVVVTVWDSVKQ